MISDAATICSIVELLTNINNHRDVMDERVLD